MGRLPGLAESNARIIQGRNRSLYQMRLTPGISLSCGKKGGVGGEGGRNIFRRFHLGDSIGLEWITCQRDASLIVIQWRIYMKFHLRYLSQYIWFSFSICIYYFAIKTKNSCKNFYFPLHNWQCECVLEITNLF